MKKLDLPKGIYNFKDIVTETDMFFDKSLFIQEILDSSGEGATIITRPRRWGKSLNLDMLKTFLAIEVDEKGNPFDVNPHRVLFEGGNITTSYGDKKELPTLKIGNVDNGSYIDKYQGKVPVIYFSLKDVVGDTYKEVESELKLQINKLFKKHEYLYNHLHSKQNKSLSDEDDIKVWTDIINKSASPTILKDSINFLSEQLYKYHDKKVFIIVDEYDKPVNYLLEKDPAEDSADLDDVAKLITTLFHKCGKTPDYLKKIVLAGIFDTIVKGGTSGFNNVYAHSVMDHTFSRSFGFTESEVNYFVDKIGFGDSADEVKQNIKNWYNGYTAPVENEQYIHTYNPWAVISYIDKAQSGNLKPLNFWTQSGTSTILKNVLKSLVDDRVKNKFYSLAQGEEVSLKFNSKVSLYDRNNPDKAEELISHLLLYSGYLTAREESGNYYFKIPNNEVKEEFEEVVTRELKELDAIIQQAVDKIDVLHYEKLILKLNDALADGGPLKPAIEAILNDDNNSLNKLFDSNKIDDCDARSLNVNLFHLAALKSNKEIIATLQDNCLKKSLTVSSKDEGLKPIDYAMMSGNIDTAKLFAQETQSKELAITIPSWTETIGCYPVGFIYVAYNLLSASVLVGSMKVYGKYVTSEAGGSSMSTAKQIAYSSALTFVLSVAKEITKYFGKDKFGLCDNYEHYSSIDISSLDDIRTPIQLEKYVLTHDNTYVDTAPGCKEGYKEIDSIKAPLHVYEGGEVLALYLCEKTSIQDEL